MNAGYQSKSISWKYFMFHEMTLKQCILPFRNVIKFTGKHLCQGLFFNKVAGLRSKTLLKKRLWHKCFPVDFVKFLRTPFLENTSRRLLLRVNYQFFVFFCWFFFNVFSFKLVVLAVMWKAWLGQWSLCSVKIFVH